MSDALLVPNVRRILVLISYEYLDYDAVCRTLASHLPATFLIATKTGLGHRLLNSPMKSSCEPIQWKPSWSLSAAPPFDSALAFWDGSDPLLQPSIRYLEKRSIPFTILNGSVNPVAPASFHATFSKETAMPTQAPTVIVDKPQLPPNYGVPETTRETKVRVTITIPEATMKLYEQQASLVKLPVDKILSDRLRTCVDHTSGRGLYFGSAERADLERITGGHLIANATIAIEKIRTVVNLRVAGVEIELTERVLARCASRAKSERKSFEQYVTKEVILGLERVVGLRPW